MWSLNLGKGGCRVGFSKSFFTFFMLLKICFSSTFPNRRFLQATVSLIISGCVMELRDQTLGGFMYMFWAIFSLPLQQKAIKCHEDEPLEGSLSQKVIITLGKATQELVVVTSFPFLLINCSYLWLKVPLFTVDWGREEIICCWQTRGKETHCHHWQRDGDTLSHKLFQLPHTFSKSQRSASRTARWPERWSVAGIAQPGSGLCKHICPKVYWHIWTLRWFFLHRCRSVSFVGGAITEPTRWLNSSECTMLCLLRFHGCVYCWLQVSSFSPPRSLFLWLPNQKIQRGRFVMPMLLTNNAVLLLGDKKNKTMKSQSVQR